MIVAAAVGLGVGYLVGDSRTDVPGATTRRVTDPVTTEVTMEQTFTETQTVTVTETQIP